MPCYSYYGVKILSIVWAVVLFIYIMVMNIISNRLLTDNGGRFHSLKGSDNFFCHGNENMLKTKIALIVHNVKQIVIVA